MSGLGAHGVLRPGCETVSVATGSGEAELSAYPTARPPSALTYRFGCPFIAVDENESPV